MSVSNINISHTTEVLQPVLHDRVLLWYTEWPENENTRLFVYSEPRILRNIVTKLSESCTKLQFCDAVKQHMV